MHIIMLPVVACSQSIQGKLPLSTSLHIQSPIIFTSPIRSPILFPCHQKSKTKYKDAAKEHVIQNQDLKT